MPTRREGPTVSPPPPTKDRNDRLAVFQSEFREDLRWWTRQQPRVADRVWSLIEEIMRSPFAGTGKPEPLRCLGSDIWSRRMTQEHRLVSLVRHERIDFLQARYHYGDA